MKYGNQIGIGANIITKSNFLISLALKHYIYWEGREANGLTAIQVGLGLNLGKAK